MLDRGFNMFISPCNIKMHEFGKSRIKLIFLTFGFIKRREIKKLDPYFEL